MDLLAVARGLRERDAQELFHEQHAGRLGWESPPGFLRVGVEFAVGRRTASTSQRRDLLRASGRRRSGC
jgi:hypothetical protein